MILLLFLFFVRDFVQIWQTWHLVCIYCTLIFISFPNKKWVWFHTHQPYIYRKMRSKFYWLKAAQHFNHFYYLSRYMSKSHKINIIYEVTRKYVKFSIVQIFHTFLFKKGDLLVYFFDGTVWKYLYQAKSKFQEIILLENWSNQLIAL